MEKEFNLSEKTIDVFIEDAIYVKDVKEFIKKLKESLYYTKLGLSLLQVKELKKKIDKLAGDKLI